MISGVPGLVTPHQYLPISENSLTSIRNDDRSFHTDKVIEHETTTKIISTSSSTIKNTPAEPATKKEPLTTTKVKRKTNDPPPSSSTVSTKKPAPNVTLTTVLSTKKAMPITTTKVITTTTEAITKQTTEEMENISSTEQPEETVKIVINGTINCTAELSSTSIPLNDTNIIKMEGHLRTPIDRIDIEAQTEYPNDIITDKNVNGGFDENETFTINVTSSLRTNNSQSTSRPSLTTASKASVSVDLVDALNTSKKTKGDYDYDYTEPTLPPSLPNLK